MSGTLISLIGGPGSTKSTTAAGLYKLMKYYHHPTMFIQEFATQLVLEKRYEDLKHQDYILTIQDRGYRTAFSGGVEYVVTDTCLLLNLIYMKAPGAIQLPSGYPDHLVDMFNQYTNKVFFINRPKVKEFQTYGRMHNEEQSMELDQQILDLLIQKRIPFDIINADFDADKAIYNRLFPHAQI